MINKIIILLLIIGLLYMLYRHQNGGLPEFGELLGGQQEAEKLPNKQNKQQVPIDEEVNCDNISQVTLGSYEDVKPAQKKDTLTEMSDIKPSSLFNSEEEEDDDDPDFFLD